MVWTYENEKKQGEGDIDLGTGSTVSEQSQGVEFDEKLEYRQYQS